MLGTHLFIGRDTTTTPLYLLWDISFNELSPLHPPWKGYSNDYPKCLTLLNAQVTHTQHHTDGKAIISTPGFSILRRHFNMLLMTEAPLLGGGFDLWIYRGYEVKKYDLRI